ncbi:MAG: DUF998 domain-containing protein [Promethearchaeota archaeon]
MSFNNWKEAFLFIRMICIVQFVILTSIAMLFYAGGTLVNPNSSGYSFWTNFFSDLGQTKGYSGKDNTVSYIIFTITLTILGISTIFFAIAMPYIFEELELENALSTNGSIFFILSGIATICVAFMPMDTFLIEHFLFVSAMTLTDFLGILFYIIAIFHNKKYPNKYAFIFLISLVVGIIYVILIIRIPIYDITTTEKLMVWTAGQKIIIYINLICSFIVCVGALKLEKSLHRSLN